MQYIKEFTNVSLVRVAQETLETRAHPMCMGKIPYTCLQSSTLCLSRCRLLLLMALGHHTHTLTALVPPLYLLLLWRLSVDTLRGISGHSLSPSVGACIYSFCCGGGERDCNDYTRDYECFWQVGPTLLITCFDYNVYHIQKRLQ